MNDCNLNEQRNLLKTQRHEKSHRRVKFINNAFHPLQVDEAAP